MIQPEIPVKQLKNLNTVPSSKLLYHRLDLLGQPSACLHFKQLATLGKALALLSLLCGLTRSSSPYILVWIKKKRRRRIRCGMPAVAVWGYKCDNKPFEALSCVRFSSRHWDKDLCVDDLFRMGSHKKPARKSGKQDPEGGERQQEFNCGWSSPALA